MFLIVYNHRKAQYHATIKNAPKGSLGAGLASLQKRDLLSNQLIAKQKELNKDKVSPTKLAKRVITQQVATLVHKGPKIIKRKIDNPQEVQVARRYGKFSISANQLMFYKHRNHLKNDSNHSISIRLIS